MMSLVSEGFDSCPMEGFDEKRIKKILKLDDCISVLIINILLIKKYIDGYNVDISNLDYDQNNVIDERKKKSEGKSTNHA